MEVKLVVAEGRSRGRSIPLPLTVFLIGRGDQCHLRPHCRLVSKLHCAIARWAGKVVVRDLKSANGTFINGQRIEGQARVLDGDTLQVGTLVFSFRIAPLSNPEMPVQVVAESDVKWLMDSPDDSFVLHGEQNTTVTELPPGFFEQVDALAASASFAETASEATGRSGSRAVSAGQLLRDYFKHSRV
jgi:pSer/pThr/pTyr-binding forkhead associated (FHA) protein